MFVNLRYCPNIVENNIKIKYFNNLVNEIIAGPFTKSIMIVMNIIKYETPYQNETLQLLKNIPFFGFLGNASFSSSKIGTEDKQILDVLKNVSGNGNDNPKIQILTFFIF